MVRSFSVHVTYFIYVESITESNNFTKFSTWIICFVSNPTIAISKFARVSSSWVDISRSKRWWVCFPPDRPTTWKVEIITWYLRARREIEVFTRLYQIFMGVLPTVGQYVHLPIIGVICNLLEVGGAVCYKIKDCGCAWKYYEFLAWKSKSQYNDWKNQLLTRSSLKDFPWPVPSQSE